MISDLKIDCDSYRSPPNEELIRKCVRSIAEFKEGLLRQLIPEEITDEEAVGYLKSNRVCFVTLPDGGEELHGFGRKLGDIFSGIDENEPSQGIHFVNRFTPVT